MAKKDNPNRPTSSRQSRREERFAKQQEQQLKTLRIIGLAIVGLIALIIIIGLIIEFVFVPQQPVANVNGTPIVMADWQDQVRFQRAQIINSIDENFELFNDADAEDQEDAAQNTIRTLQQFFGQQIGVLVNGHEQLGEGVLEGMISTELVKQEAAARGITVSDSEVDALVGERYAYYDGGLPTPFPTAEPTVEPTPSITPIPDPAAAVVEEAEPTIVFSEGEAAPTATPRPTNTPVSEASFNEQLKEDQDKLSEQGVDPSFSRLQAQETIMFRKLGKLIYEENGGTGIEPHLSTYLIVYSTQEEAEAGLAQINADGYLAVWNQIRSLPSTSESSRPPQAIERIAWTADQFDQSYEGLSGSLFELTPGTASGIIEDADGQSSLPIYVIAQVISNEDLELSASRIEQLENNALQEWISDQRQNGNIEVFENWKNRIPRQPLLDSRYSLPVPTPTVLSETGS